MYEGLKVTGTNVRTKLCTIGRPSLSVQWVNECLCCGEDVCPNYRDSLLPRAGSADAPNRGRPDGALRARAAPRPVAAPGGEAPQHRLRVDPQLSVQGQKD